MVEHMDYDPKDDPLLEAEVLIRQAMNKIDEYGTCRELSLAKTKLQEAIFWIHDTQED
jgi:hypothetical protein